MTPSPCWWRLSTKPRNSSGLPKRDVAAVELEFVVRAFGAARDEELPDAARAERAHRVQATVPAVEVADDADRARVRRPDRERGAGDAVDLAHVRAELLVQLFVAAFAGEVQVELAERRHERVRVPDRERVAVGVGDFELVVERQALAREECLPEAGGILQLSLDAGWLHAHALSLGAQ